MKIRKLFAILLMLFTFVPSTVIAGIFAAHFTQVSKQAIGENMELAATEQAQNIKGFFSWQTAALRILTRQPLPQQFLREINEGKTPDPKLDAACKQILTSYTEEEDYLLDAFLLNGKNQMIASGQRAQRGKDSPLAEKDFALLLQGQSLVADLYQGFPGLTEERCFFLAVPFHGESMEGAAVLAVNASYFQTFVDKADFLRTGNITILTASGNIVATGSSALQPYSNINDLDDGKILFEKLQKEDSYSGVIDYRLAGENKLADFDTVEGLGWQVFSCVQRTEYTEPLYMALKIFCLIVAIVGALGAAVLILLARTISRPVSDLLQVIHKRQNGDRKIRFHYDKPNELGEIAAALNNFMDKIEEDNRELYLREERYRIVSRQSGRIVFEYGMADHQLYCSPGYREKFGYELSNRICSPDITRLSLIHPNDIGQTEEMLDKLEHGQEECECELRLPCADSGYLWCSLQTTALRDESGRMLKIIGTITDIDQKQKERTQLLKKAQFDDLTGLYNKSTAEFLIQNRLLSTPENGALHALFVIDIDNFKSINDSLGHLAGDQVLRAVAARLLSQFRSTDILGRFGGDEFVALMRDLHNPKTAVEKARELTETFHAVSVGTPEGHVSGSIGVSFYPRDGICFSELFAQADAALYQAKRKGKDCFSVSDSENPHA